MKHSSSVDNVDVRGTFITENPEETYSLASRLASRFLGREVVLLYGELGAGKTVFAKGVASGCGVSNSDEVLSPAFTLVNIYKGRWPVFHFDLYRLEKAEEVDDLGLEDYLGEGVVIVEWAENLPFLLEGFKVKIEYTDVDNQRRITISQVRKSDQ